MGKAKQLRSKQNKQFKAAKSLLQEYNQEIEQYKDCKESCRLPQIEYNKELKCFVML